MVPFFEEVEKGRVFLLREYVGIEEFGIEQEGVSFKSFKVISLYCFLSLLEISWEIEGGEWEEDKAEEEFSNWIRCKYFSKI